MPTLIQKLSNAAALKEAQAAASSYFTAQPISARMHENQGMYSRTAVITLSDETEAIVQLKDNEIDLTKVILARSLLGDVVPDVHAARCTKVHFAYVAPLIPGVIWSEGDLSLNEDVSVVTQVAHLLTKCSLGIDSSGIVDHYVLPRLRKILEKEDISDDSVRVRIEKLSGMADQLKVLPLSLCHIDINARNIIVNGEEGNSKLVGLIDWEQASLLPFGMNAWCIRYLSVPIIGGKDRATDRTKPMAEAFWKELTKNLSVESQRTLVVAMQIGFVLLSMFPEGGQLFPHDLAQCAERLDWFETLYPM